MKIVVGSDHAGFKRKEEIKEYLRSKNIEVVDVGTDSTASVDYPIFGFKAKDAFIKERADYLFGFCGSGVGIGISINKRGGNSIIAKSLDSVIKAKKEGINQFSFGERNTTFDVVKMLVDEILK